MRRYLAQTAIAMLQGLVLIFMAPAFLLVFVALAAWTAISTSYDFLRAHAEFNGDKEALKKAQDKETWRMP